YFSGETSVAGVGRRDEAITTPTFMQRFELHAMFEMPVVHSILLDWNQRYGFRETGDTHSPQSMLVLEDALNRLSFEYRSQFLGAQLERDYGSWRHVIEPSVETRFLGGPDRFQNTIVVDDIDLITRTNEVEYAITNRFFTTRELFSWRL